jgi:Fe-S-cluster containining protein
LTHKVDAFFARVSERHGTDMQCDTGCSDCCHVRLTITAVEAAAIRTYVAGWSAAQRRALAPIAAPTSPRKAARASAGVAATKRSATRIADDNDDQACAALDPAGRCRIYAARPLVCRSHGVPIRLRQGGLPVVQSCHRNFVRTTPDADCVLDQTTLSAVLLAIDAEAHRADPGTDPKAPGQRVELAGLLAELASI